MEVSWDKLKQILGSGSVDMLLTFMTWGFQRNRNVARSERTMNSVFGNENWKQNENFVDLYCKQIQGLKLGNRKPYQTTVLAVDTAVGNRYHLIFVSTSELGAHGPFGWIKKHIDEVDLALLGDAFRGGTIDGSDLDYWIKKSGTISSNN